MFCKFSRLLSLRFVAAACLVALGTQLGLAAAGSVTNSVESSVVKIFADVRYPDYFKPWAKRSSSEVTGSGVVISGKRILSNAHVVLYASQVQVQASQTGDKLSATVEYIAPDIDLAVLKLDDEKFFDDHPPLATSDALPDVRDSVMVYGYPEGGSSLSVTKGIVSRIEFSGSAFRAGSLWIQIDAAINPGNSGGPAVVGDKLIGITYSRLRGADNIGYIIPREEIDIFLKDIADGRYEGKFSIYDEFQTLENPALRTYLKLPKTVEGMIVNKPNKSILGNPLKQWDILTRIGDVAVDNVGEIKADSKLRVKFSYLIQKIAKDDKLPVTVFRDGKEMQLNLPLARKRPTIAPTLEGTYPSYFVCGPMVFSTATADFIGALRQSDLKYSALVGLLAQGSPLIKRMVEPPTFEGETMVVISSPFFPHKLSKGYANPAAQVVKTINGVRVKNLPHLVELLRDSKDEFITMEFDSNAFETFVFQRRELLASTDEILSDNGVRSQGSPDMLAIWNGKKL